jgi:class 3 adenylate cyclase
MTKPITRLFLSADIAGSTAYKQKHLDTHTAEWPSVFIKFFLGLPGHFNAEAQDLVEKVRRSPYEPAPEPVMWKAIGDEVVFWQEVKNELQVALSVLAWRNALIRYRSDLKNESLDVKGAAWTATFPFPNRELAIPKHLKAAIDSGEPITTNEANLQNSTDFVLDFIGPNIDSGFRIASRSTPRQMQISLEVADCLSCSASHLPAHAIFFAGATELKGVHIGRPYPLFWLDSSDGDSFSAAEDRLLGRRPATPQEIKAMTEASLEGAGLPTCYLENADDSRFRRETERLKKVKERIESHIDRNPDSPTDSANSETNGAVIPPDFESTIQTVKQGHDVSTQRNPLLSKDVVDP